MDRRGDAAAATARCTSRWRRAALRWRASWRRCGTGSCPRASVYVDRVSRSAREPAWSRRCAAGAAAPGARGDLRYARYACATPIARFDTAPSGFDEVAALVRRWIEARRSRRARATTGVHIVDAESARFGDFDAVQLAGLVDGEWPERPRRNIFYSPGILRDLGWPRGGRSAARRRARRLSTCCGCRPSAWSSRRSRSRPTRWSAPSTLLDELEDAGLPTRSRSRRRRRASSSTRRSALEPVCSEALPPAARAWAGASPRGRRPARAALSRLHRHPSGASLVRERARTLSGLSVQVLRRRRPAAGGSAGGRVGAVAARARPVHPRGLSAVLRSLGRASGEAPSPPTGSTRRARSSQRSQSRCWRVCPRPTRHSSAAGCSAPRSRSGSSTWCSASKRPGRSTVRERWLEYRLDGEFSLARRPTAASR